MGEEPTRGQSRPEGVDTSGLSGWVTTDVAARAVRVSPRTIRRFIDRGKLKAKVEGEGVERRWLVDVDSLHALRASRTESSYVRELSGEEENADRIADIIRELAARVEERTAEAVEMRIRLELSEQAHSTVEEDAQRLREENERLRRELEALREARESSVSYGGPLYGTSPQEAEESLHGWGAPSDAPDRTAEVADKGDVPPEPQEPSERRSWLYRFFFGPG